MLASIYIYIYVYIYIYIYVWAVVKIRVPFWVPNIIRHLIFRVPKRDHHFDNHLHIYIYI